MQVAALIVYDRALSAAEQAQVLSYLEGKYGAGGGGSGNGSPVAMDDTGTVISESSVQLFVLDNDTDADGVLNESSVTVVTAPSNGDAVVNSDGSITYMHDVGNTATSDTFTYQVSDDQGAQSNLASVSLTITGGGSGNGSPVAMDDTGTVASESSVQLSVLDNDTDPDGELNQSSVTVVTAPSNGDAVVNSDGSITYMHDVGNTATSDTFTYQVSDDQGAQSNLASVLLTITGGSTGGGGGSGIGNVPETVWRRTLRLIGE